MHARPGTVWGAPARVGSNQTVPGVLPPRLSPSLARARSLMVGAGFAVGAVGSSSLVAVVALLWRAGPLERATANAPQHPEPLEWATGTFNFDTAASGTCPASCPAPSVAFCLGPIWDPIEERIEFLISAARAQPGWIAALFSCGLCLALGVAIGRYTAPPPPLRRPHGRRPGPSGVGRRGRD